MEINIRIVDNEDGSATITVDCNPPLTEETDDTTATHLAAAAVRAMKMMMEITESTPLEDSNGNDAQDN